MLDKMLDKIPEAFSKDSDSNVGKLLNFAATEIEDLEETVNKIRLWRDIDEAEGETLDRIGYNVQQSRGQATDDVFRILIKTKIARNMSDGSINTLIDVIAMALDVDKSEIIIRELWNDPEKPEPAAIFIESPTETLLDVGMSLQQFTFLCSRMVVAGVGVQMLLKGTFQFSSIIDESEFADDKGFGEYTVGHVYGYSPYGTVPFGGIGYIEGGGYFGGIFNPSEDQELPI